MAPSTPSTVSYHLYPSPEPSIFFFEADFASPSSSSRQTLSTDSSTLYATTDSYSDWHYPKNYSKMSSIEGPRHGPRILPPPPRRILTAAPCPSRMVCLLSIYKVDAEGALDPNINERRRRVQLERTLAKSKRQNVMLADEDAFEVEVLKGYPQAPVLKTKRRPLWVWAMRKVVRACRAVGRGVFCLE